MAWTTPKDWAVDEQLTASKLNTHLRDNLNALKSPPSDDVVLNEASDFTVNSSSFVDVDASLAVTITTGGGDVMVGFAGTVQGPTGTVVVYLDVEVDEVRDGGDDGYLCESRSSGVPRFLSFVRLITGLDAGAHTFKLQAKTSGGAITFYAGAGTSGRDLHSQFWVREVS